MDPLNASDSTFLHHAECPKCGSRDNLGVFTDHSYCFGCGYWRKEDGGSVSERSGAGRAPGLLDFHYPTEAIFAPKGKLGLIEPEVCRRGLYGLGDWHGTECHVANYVDRDRRIIGQKIRLPRKGVGFNSKAPDKVYFPWCGTAKGAMPFGYHLWQKGKRLLVVEGEKDWLAASTIQKMMWPVWSVINGAGSAGRDLLKAGDALSQFDEIVLMLDSDEAGQRAAEAAAKELVGAFNVLIAPPLALKDVFEMLQAGRGDEVVKSIWNAARYRPKTIVSALDIVPKVKERRKVFTTPYPWQGLNDTLGGAYGNEIVTIVAGSGTGKSTVCRSLLHHFQANTEDKVGGLFIEEDVETTLSDIIGMHRGVNLRVNPDALTPDEIDATAKELFAEKDLPLFDLSFETIDTDELLNQLRFLAKVEGCKRIFLDHLSFIIGGMDVPDERKAIDMAMTKLRGFVKSTGVSLYLVVHLKRPEGNRGYDEGLKVSTNFIRGSQAIEQISDVVLALQRNKRDEQVHNWVEVVSLKNRHNGKDGMTACWLEYSPETGLLKEGSPPTGFEPEEMGDDDYAEDGSHDPTISI